MKEKLVLNILLITTISIFTGCAGGIANFTGTPLEKKFAKKDLESTVKYLSTQDIKALRYDNDKDILQLAINNNFFKLADYIIDNKLVDINHVNKLGSNTLYYALPYPKYVKKLLDNGSIVNLKDRKGLTPLHNVSLHFKNHTEVMKMLLDHGADINTKSDNNNLTPLNLAVRGNKFKNAEFLLNNGAKTDNGKSLLSAMWGKQTDLINLLIEKKANINNIDPYGNNVLHYLAQEGSPKNIKKAINQGANVNGLNKRGLSPLSNLIQIILRNTENSNSRTLVYSSNDENSIYELIDNGANINFTIRGLGAYGHDGVVLDKAGFIDLANRLKSDKLMKLLQDK